MARTRKTFLTLCLAVFLCAAVLSGNVLADTEPVETIDLVEMEDIPEENMALYEIPEGEIPLAELPLAEVPMTGEAAPLWTLLPAAALSGLGLLWAAKKKSKAM